MQRRFFGLVSIAFLLLTTHCNSSQTSSEATESTAADSTPFAGNGTQSTSGSTTSSVSGSATGGTMTGTTSGTTTGGSVTVSTGPAVRVAGNPFAGASMYVNPDYAHNTLTSLANVAAGSNDARLIAAAQKLPTAVWLDSMNALAGGNANAGRLSLTGHLDAALAQASAGNTNVIVTLIVYDLPDRDCAAAASNGELHGTAGLATYKNQYIDVIYQAITSKAAYNSLRFALVVEPDSLPNMVTNTSIAACAAVNSANLYVDGVAYAIQRLGSLPNAYLYLDIAHAGWLGWPNNMSGAVTLFTQVVSQANHGDLSIIRGFSTDVSNYTPAQEPYINASNAGLLNGSFYQSNPMFDELSYVKALHDQFISAGFSNIGFITDTSRSGWALVNNGQPIDRRTARGNWCNVSGAGLGARPQASPSLYAGWDAFVYIKPPGESDGSSSASNSSNAPDAQGKRFDLHCDSTNASLQAMPNAPDAGAWFDTEFMMLLHNATPAL